MTAGGTHRPVVFLNPAVILDSSGATYKPGAVPAVGATGPVSMRNGSVEALNDLCRRLGAVIVCTAPREPYDPRDSLMADGVQPSFALDWRTDWTFPDRSAAITRWHVAHGRPLAVVIDRPGIDVPGLTHALVSDRATLGPATVEALVSALGEKRA